MDLHFLKSPRSQVKAKCRRNGLRRAAASIEVVMATAVSFTAASLLAYNGMRACRNLYHAVANLVGWPFL